MHISAVDKPAPNPEAGAETAELFGADAKSLRYLADQGTIRIHDWPFLPVFLALY